ncbi:MAG: gephyrin-like molybdotransferase Glp [Porticoccaceae bacterium]
MIPVEQALEHILSGARPVCSTEQLKLDHALGRTLSSPIFTPVDVPPSDNSAMDGYAVFAADIELDASYPVSQRISAGMDSVPLKPGTVARIFTGANIPSGADAVIAQEDSLDQGDQVQFTSLAKKGDHIRSRGQDMKKDSEILAAGKVLRPQEIGLIASCGIAEAEVYKKLKVAIVSTGDELVEPGQQTKPGQIYNSNSYLLKSFCTACGFEAISFMLVPDQLDRTVSALEKAASEADVIITTGGVSVGEEDHVRPAIAILGRLDMWKVTIKPGKPIALGKIGNTDLIGLPGNPASVFTTFLILALPRLRLLQGRLQKDLQPEILSANFSRPAGSRQEYLRARKTAQGVEIFPNQSSGVLSSACWGDGFAVQPSQVEIRMGQPVEFLSYQSLIAG